MRRLGGFEFKADLGSRVGEGAFATVYRGRNAATNEAVAVKVLPAACVKKSELERIASLDSPFLVRILFVEEAEPDYHIVMDLCDCTLMQHLQARILTHSGGPIQEENLRRLVYCLANGYAALHQASIIHRDLKPDNILIKYERETNGVDADGIFRLAKIGDFGSSRISDENTKGLSGSLAGTPLYMAPEVGANVLAQSAYDAQVDMWSLGCLIYHAAIGQVPFDESALCKLFLASSTGSFNAYTPPLLPHSLPDYVSQLIQALLTLDPSKRLRPPELLSLAAALRPEGRRSRRESLSSWRSEFLKQLLAYLRDLL